MFFFPFFLKNMNILNICVSFNISNFHTLLYTKARCCTFIISVFIFDRKSIITKVLGNTITMHQPNQVYFIYKKEKNYSQKIFCT
jgi:hypothetical protein